MIDHEITFLGQILIDKILLNKYYIHEELFLNSKTRIIYKAIKEIVQNGHDPDIVMLRESKYQIDMKDILTLSDVPSSANSDFYYKQILTDFKKVGINRIMNYCRDSLKSGTNPDDQIIEINNMIGKISKINGSDKINEIGDLMIPYMNMIEERYKSKGELPGIETGFDTLDQFTLGLKPKEMIVVGARPSDGKTALMLNMAVTAFKNDYNPCIINLESNNNEMITRILSQYCSINSQKIITGTLEHKDFDKLIDAAGDISKHKMYLYDAPNITIDEVILRSRQAVNQYGCKIIFIDYIQIIRNNGKMYSKREKVEDVSLRLKDLARELDIPIVIMAQLNRNAANTIPTVSEFKESGQIEQDADVAILIYHKRKKDEENISKEIEQSYLIVDKNRNGQKGQIKVKFRPEFVKFFEQEYYHEN